MKFLSKSSSIAALACIVALTAMGLAFGVGHSFAAEPDPWGINPTKCNFTSGSGLLNLDGSGIFRVVEQETCAGLLADYMVAMINFFFRLAIVLAVLMVAIGGFQWLMAVGNSSKISNAKDTIQQAIIGLILALTATLLFSQIDTTFTEFDRGQFRVRVDPSQIRSVEGCFQYTPQKYMAEDNLPLEQARAKAIEQCTVNGCKWEGSACMPRAVNTEGSFQGCNAQTEAEAQARWNQRFGSNAGGSQYCYLTLNERHCQSGVRNSSLLHCCKHGETEYMYAYGNGRCKSECVNPDGDHEIGYWNEVALSECDSRAYRQIMQQ